MELDKYSKDIERLNKSLGDITRLFAKERDKTIKAIEYIENHQLVFELYSIEEIIKWFDTYYKNVLYILKGEDKE